MTHTNLLEWLISLSNALLPSNLHHLWGCGHEPPRRQIVDRRRPSTCGAKLPDVLSQA